jgi:hypothetical protein
VVTTSTDQTARVWDAPLEESVSEQLIDVINLLPAIIGHLVFEANGFLKPIANSRVIECRDQISKNRSRLCHRSGRLVGFLSTLTTKSAEPVKIC